jgi:hypothetical protein
MKTLKYFFYVLLVSVLAIACDEREYDIPSIAETGPVYKGKPANYTIKQLKESSVYGVDGPTEIKEDLIIKGYVTANDESGNLYKSLYIQDETAGIQLSIDRSGLNSAFKVGQKVYVQLKGLYTGKYGQVLQVGKPGDSGIGRMSADELELHVFRDSLPDLAKATPETVTLTQAETTEYIGRLVRIENLAFNNGGKTIFAPQGAGSAQSEIVKDADGKTMEVRTSTYANFAGDSLPTGPVTLIGIMGKYNSTWQFTIRTREDVTAYIPAPGQGANNPYDVTTALAQEYSDAKFWTKGFIVGTVAAGVNSANPIDAADDVALTADFLNTTILIATDATETDFTKMLVVNLPENSAMRTALNLMDKPANKGKEVTVYGNAKEYFGAHSIYIATGSAAEFVFGDPVVIPEGDGTKEKPYSITQAQANQGAAGNTDYKWVEGYVVGIWEGKDASGNDLYPNNFAKFEPPFYTNANIFIADSPTETSTGKMVNVQIGATTRDVLSPMINAAVLGQKIAVKGSLEKYNTFPGIKNLQEYVYDGGTTPPEPPTPPTEENVFFTETFGNGDYPSGNRPKIAAFTDFDMKAPFVFSDQYDVADIRSTNSISPSVWLPAFSATFDATSQLKITGIASGYTQMKLIYDIATNSATNANANKIAVKCNDVAVTVPSTTFSANNAFTTITLTIPDNTTTIEFFSDVAVNKEGYRLDNIKISGVK